MSSIPKVPKTRNFEFNRSKTIDLVRCASDGKMRRAEQQFGERVTQERERL